MNIKHEPLNTDCELFLRQAAEAELKFAESAAGPSLGARYVSSVMTTRNGAMGAILMQSFN